MPGTKRGRPSTNESHDMRVQYGMWLGMPVEARQPDERTKKDYAKKTGVAEKTLWLWEQDPLVLDIAKNALKLWAGNHKLMIIKKIIQQAEEGEWQQQRLFMEWQGEIGNIPKAAPQPKAMDITLTTDKEKPKEENAPKTSNTQ